MGGNGLQGDQQTVSDRACAGQVIFADGAAAGRARKRETFAVFRSTRGA